MDGPPLRHDRGTQDGALDFLQANQSSVDSSRHTDSAYARRLRRKVDFIVMPFLILCYTMNAIDKILINVRARHESSRS